MEQHGRCMLKQHLHMDVLHQCTVTLSSCASGDLICRDKSEIKFGKPIHVTDGRVSLQNAVCSESLRCSEQSTKPHGPSLQSSRLEVAAVVVLYGQGCRALGTPDFSFPLNSLSSVAI